MNDLNVLPKDCAIPARPNARGHRSLGNIIRIAKSDFDYMAERHFAGRFAIYNRRDGSGHMTSSRIAALLSRNEKTIVLSIAQKRRDTKSPDGATWRTVRLLSAYRTEDGKLCVIEIAPPGATRMEVSDGD